MPKTKSTPLIYITWSRGFIWRNLVSKLSDGRRRPIEIEDSTYPFWEDLKEGDIVVHLGAYSSTTCNNPNVYKKLNTDYTKNLIDVCAAKKAKLIYASSAAVYWNGNWPLNDYGRSKLEIDEYAQMVWGCVWLRFFNVYGWWEYNKWKDASMISQWMDLYKERLELFKVKAERDFVHVNDVVKVIQFFMNNFKPWIYDVGTGEAVSFDDVADEIIKLNNLEGKEYISFPRHLKGKYQFHTQADLTKLREAGYTGNFLSIYEGLRLMKW